MAIIPTYYTTTAIRDGVTDAQPQLQADIDYCVANGITALFLPKGTYKILSPLLVYKNNTIGGYAQVTLKIFGEGSMWDSFPTTVIQTNFTDVFALGIQQGKGCTIEGISISGKYNPPYVSDRVFYNRELTDCTDGICRQERFSPNTGIAIDPFSNGQIPGDSGYPNMTSYYKGNNSNSGSTATTITRCIISNFPVGICSSPNGFTRNAELTRIEYTKFANCPLWISGGHDQEKANSIYNVAGWNETHTCFANAYGNRISGNWSIDIVNVAGRCNRFISNQQQAYFPTSINNAFVEGIGQFGIMETNIVSKVSNSIFHFVPAYMSGLKRNYIYATNIKFDTCIFRNYGYNHALPVQVTGCLFDNCEFSGVPLQNHPSNDTGAVSKFDNCRVGVYRFGITGKKSIYLKSVNTVLTYGNYVIEETAQLSRANCNLLLIGANNDAYASITKDINKAITVTNYSFSFTSVNVGIYALNEAIQIISGQSIYFAIITGIVGDLVTVSHCPNDLISGTYTLSSISQVSISTMIGDITTGSNIISNVSVSWGQLSVGSIIQSSYSTGKWLRITAINGTSYTVSENLNATKTGAYFGHNTTQELQTPVNTVLSTLSILLRKGDIVKRGGNADNSIEYKVTKTGWLMPPSGDTRLAVLETNEQLP